MNSEAVKGELEGKEEPDEELEEGALEELEDFGREFFTAVPMGYLQTTQHNARAAISGFMMRK